jgi:type IV pilus assembly protein PilV
MQRTLLFNSRAFTLVEVMVSIIILTIGLLGMLTVINLAITTNLQNEMRNQAVLIAEQQMAQKKSLPFENITATGEKSINSQTVMRAAITNFTVTQSVDNVGNSKQVNIGVTWKVKGNKYEHAITTLVTTPATN